MPPERRRSLGRALMLFAALTSASHLSMANVARFTVQTVEPPTRTGMWWLAGQRWECPPRLLRCSGLLPANMAVAEACERVVAQVGEARSFSGPGGPLSTSELSVCNRAAGAADRLKNATAAHPTSRLDHASSTRAPARSIPEDPPTAAKPGPAASLRTAQPPRWLAFDADQARCSDDRGVARLTLSVQAQLEDGFTDDKATMELVVNDQSVARWSAPVTHRVDPLHRHPTLHLVQFEQALELPGDKIAALVKLRVADGPWSEGRTLRYGCIQAATRVKNPDSPGTIARPDLWVDHSFIVMRYLPQAPNTNNCQTGAPYYQECRIDWQPTGDQYISRLRSVVATNLDPISLDVTGVCNGHAPQDTVRLSMWVGIGASEVLPNPYLGADTRLVSSRMPPDDPGQHGYVLLPEQRLWARFDRDIRCDVTNGVLEYRIDPDNRLQERDESNNHIRVRYVLTPPTARP
ncbi:hypothetical protein AACH06_25330 [Ideonella sp. DXS29W]|uniref:CARDB domain-containing protein n=1 Tax=Ideonella lacteola TaxID=2984193 RepID=A0ABU9BW14_9BURK